MTNLQKAVHKATFLLPELLPLKGTKHSDSSFGFLLPHNSTGITDRFIGIAPNTLYMDGPLSNIHNIIIDGIELYIAINGNAFTLTVEEFLNDTGQI